MTIEKPVPCSIYDIPGMQEWLDEMALQGLFLEKFNHRCDRAVFRQGGPAPVRYRLDPAGKNTKKDREREELYTQMGWKYVGRLSRLFHVYSCDNPSAPELYSDTQSLALALENVTRRRIRANLLISLAAILLPVIRFLLNPYRSLKNILLWENPRSLAVDLTYLSVMVILLPLLAIESRMYLKAKDTLAQGLPLKAKKRHVPLPWYVVWACIYLPIYILPKLLFPSVGWDVCGLEDFTPSRAWPTMAQTEALGPRPLEMEPYAHGYVQTNDSYFAPVQEYISTDWEVRFPSDTAPRSYDYWSGVRYVQASSPWASKLIFRLELWDASRTLNNWAKWTDHSFHITGSPVFIPQDWPGLDRLEVAEYQQMGRSCWTFAAWRGTDILVVNYLGYARWEDCLPLFLEALDGEETAP